MVGSVVDLNENGDVLFRFVDSPSVVAIRDPFSPAIPNASYQLSFLPDETVSFTGLNSTLQVVGDIDLDLPHAEGETRVYQLVGGEFVLTHTFFSNNRWGRPRINDNGIVAYSVLAKGGTSNASTYDTATDATKALTAEWSGADDVNSAGQVCGMLSPKTHKEPDLGFIYDPAKGFWHLYDLVYAMDPADEAAFLENGGSVYLDFSMSDPVTDSSTGFAAICKGEFILVPEPVDVP
jgi:hypothetical protein